MEKITQCLIFPEIFAKPIHFKFDEPHSSSDGGALLLKAADQKLQLTSSLAACLVDKRQAAKVKHTIADLLRQRIYGLASGYADANDAARLSHDPVFKLLLDRAPLEGPELSSQPTLSRFENRIGPRENYRLGATLAQSIINRHQRRRHRKAKRVTIDLDTTDDPTHGQQEFTFFNRHYDTYCYLPLLAFISFDNEPEQYLVTALLRPSNLTEKSPDVVGLLSRLVLLVRAAFPKAMLNLRLDGGFACPAMLDFLDSVPRLEYVCGLSKNAVLERKAQPLLAQVRKREKQGRKPRLYGECRYRAKSWDRTRRVIIKAEIVYNLAGEAKDNPRFVVTNKSQAPKTIYRRAYCSRGEIENRIKELQLGMEIDRTSCSHFQANQFRVLLTVAAYALMQEIRLQAKPTRLARAQVTTLREQLLKLSARIEQSVRRLVVHLPHSFAYLNEWTRIARRLGAAPA
ncbi:MAG TPA: IS1380 family transposase [Pyrinomonadaceae bacterium]|nr:IS1380 family transposase [Pyrinomonadaceae bacterium]